MRRIIAGTVCCFWLTCSMALAEGDGRESPKTPPDVGDEIIVLGKSWAEIRAQIQRAQEAVYDRFNEINSNDEFDSGRRDETARHAGPGAQARSLAPREFGARGGRPPEVRSAPRRDHCRAANGGSRRAAL
jgi:hypothetical protein